MSYGIALPSAAQLHATIEGHAYLECEGLDQISFLRSQCDEHLNTGEGGTDGTSFALPAGTNIEPGAYHDDDSPVWGLHSGGPRHQVADWRYPEDHNLAKTAAALFSPYAQALLQLAVNYPGEMLAAEWIAEQLGLKNHFGVAAIMHGFSRGCEEAGRSYPVTWWRHSQGAEGRGALYAVPPSWAKLFAVPLQDVAVPIGVRSERWYTELVPQLLRLIVCAAHKGQQLRYKSTAAELNNTVPGARVNFRKGMSQLLHDLQQGLVAIDADLPLVTACVVNHTGRPAGRFYALAESLGYDISDRGGLAAEHQRHTATLTTEQVEKLAADLGEPDLVSQIRATSE